MDMLQIHEPTHPKIRIDSKHLEAIGMTEPISKIMAEVDRNTWLSVSQLLGREPRSHAGIAEGAR
jgi:hypothetical protein